MKEYWNKIVKDNLDSGSSYAWRLHMRGIYEKLILRWFGNKKYQHILKTDLYDEAVTPYHLFSLLKQHCEHFIGIDLSAQVVQAAKKKLAQEVNGRCNTLACDVRNLAFKSETFDAVVSNSTLDHFSKKADIKKSLEELSRVLEPGGALIVTLDNPSNPSVLIRNILPYRLLKFFHFIPYRMGKTLSKSELVSTLKLNGFGVEEATFIDHAPRLFLAWAGYVLNKINNKLVKYYFYLFMRELEKLERSPFAFLSGHFVAVKAIRQ